MAHILLALCAGSVQSDTDDAGGDEMHGLRRGQTRGDGSDFYGYQ